MIETPKLDKFLAPTGQCDCDDQKTTSLQSFLMPTKYCNCTNKKVKLLAAQITLGKKNDTERAVALFYWVRDNIAYTFGSWQKKSSHILKQGRGMCTNKAVLLVALLRSINIPAGFGRMEVLGQEYFGTVTLEEFKPIISKKSVHYFVYIFLNNSWIKIDPSADISLARKIGYFNPQAELVDWDGKNDAMEKIDKKHILREDGPLANIDDKLNKKPKRGRRITMIIGNVYLDFLRSLNIRTKKPKTSELKKMFEKWLFKKSVVKFFLLKLFLNAKNGK